MADSTGRQLLAVSSWLLGLLVLIQCVHPAGSANSPALEKQPLLSLQLFFDIANQ
jgi:hypothetical protein